MTTIRIQNGGEPGYMTRVTNTETGETIPFVTRLEIVLDANSRQPMPVARLEVGFPVVDIIADAEIREVCPVCKKPLGEPGSENRLLDLIQAYHFFLASWPEQEIVKWREGALGEYVGVHEKWVRQREELQKRAREVLGERV